MARRPLLMMRKKNLLGSFFGKHFGIPHLSKSVGNYYDVGGAGYKLQPIAGWTGRQNCEVVLLGAELWDTSAYTAEANIAVTGTGFSTTSPAVSNNWMVRYNVPPFLEIGAEYVAEISGTWANGFNIRTGGTIQIPNITSGGIYTFTADATDLILQAVGSFDGSVNISLKKVI